ncbi:MAG: hypothetical protein MUF62_03335 [Chitinophagaceae bacterium]|nr:hypothetical protein [Chitinophagaceae bacterium]
MNGKRWRVAVLVAAAFIVACHPTHSPVPAASDTAQNSLAITDRLPYLSAQQLAEGLAAAPILPPIKQLQPPFDSLSFDKAIAYDYNGAKGEPTLYIVEDGRLAPTVLAQQPLGQQEVAAVLGLLSSRRAYGDAPAFCFEPHLGIVLYRADTVVGHLSICISCKRLASSPALPPGIFRLIQMQDGPSYPADGLNDRALLQLRKWLKQWQFRLF